MTGYHVGDCLDLLRSLPSGSVNACVTSPPYWGLRDYGKAGQLGLEKTPDEYVARMVEVFGEVKRALRDDGTLWLNLGDSYVAGTGHAGNNPSAASTLRSGKGVAPHEKYGSAAVVQRIARAPGLAPKNLVGIPWRVAFALQADGWYLRSDIIWHKPNPMPESVRDRPTKAHEYLFLLSKSPTYFYDADAVREPVSASTVNPEGRNRRSVWTVTPRPYRGAHFAVMPEALVEPCVLAGCPAGGIVLDPFGGSGTTAVVAERLGRRWCLFDLNEQYAALARERIGAAA